MALKSTNEEKALKGTLKDSKKKTLKTAVLTRMPKPAFELTDEARKTFRGVCKLMMIEGVATALDVYAITMFAFWFNQFVTVQKKLLAEGMVQEYKSGANNVSGFLTATEKADTKTQQYMKVLGLTPKHREMINAYADVGTDEQEDGWVMMFKAINENNN